MEIEKVKNEAEISCLLSDKIEEQKGEENE